MNGCRGTPAPPPRAAWGTTAPTAPHSTPLFPTVNKKNTLRERIRATKPQVRKGGAEWGPAAAGPRAEPTAGVPGRVSAGSHASRMIVVERSGAPRAAFAVLPVEHNGLAFPMNIAAGVPTTYCRVERLRRVWWQ
ncbi:hypothetical protein GCM10009736_07010 [Actinomadura bangladeshensis]